jgi:hypothetical protein
VDELVGRLLEAMGDVVELGLDGAMIDLAALEYPVVG